MSQENIELVRRAYEALNAGDIDGLVTLCHKDFNLDMSDRIFNPERYQGHEGIRGCCAEVVDAQENARTRWFEPCRAHCQWGWPGARQPAPQIVLRRIEWPGQARLAC